MPLATVKVTRTVKICKNGKWFDFTKRIILNVINYDLIVFAYFLPCYFFEKEKNITGYECILQCILLLYKR